MVLLDIIKIFHFVIILLVLCAPFYNKRYLAYSIIILIYIYYKWKIDGSCIVTRLEHSISGNKEESGFIYRLINPFLGMEKKEFGTMLETITLVWIIILIIIYICK
jgi:hypothetical protein